MALRTICPHCKKAFTAPEDYRGKRIDCPACARRFILRTEEDIQAVSEKEEAEKKRLVENREKLELIERAEARGQRKAGRPYYEEFQTGVEPVRHYNPKAHSRFSRFRALSDFLVLGAYVELLLVAVGIGLLVYLRITGSIATVTHLLVLSIAWLGLGLCLFLFFKYLGELAFLLADIGDQQNDVVQLLQDIRDNTDSQGT
jgi:DNA-directed RNA polymerase subunit RPC12/RpoP